MLIFFVFLGNSLIDHLREELRVLGRKLKELIDDLLVDLKISKRGGPFVTLCGHHEVKWNLVAGAKDENSVELLRVFNVSVGIGCICPTPPEASVRADKCFKVVAVVDAILSIDEVTS